MVSGKIVFYVSDIIGLFGDFALCHESEMIS